MKTAISLPDAVYQSAEELARRLGVSRSELYATAVAEYVAQYGGDEITARLDSVYTREKSSLDEKVMAAQVRSLHEQKW